MERQNDLSGVRAPLFTARCHGFWKALFFFFHHLSHMTIHHHRWIMGRRWGSIFARQPHLKGTALLAWGISYSKGTVLPELSLSSRKVPMVKRESFKIRRAKKPERVGDKKEGMGKAKEGQVRQGDRAQSFVTNTRGL